MVCKVPFLKVRGLRFAGECSGAGLGDANRGKGLAAAGTDKGQAVGLAAGDCGGFVEVDAGSAAGVPAVHQRGAAPEFQRGFDLLAGVRNAGSADGGGALEAQADRRYSDAGFHSARRDG